MSKPHKSKIKYVKVIVLIILLIVLIILSYLNIKKDICNFFRISIGNVLTIGVAIIVSYVLVEQHSDDLKRKEALIRLLEAIQELVNNSNLWLVNDNSTSFMTMGKRQLNNYIDILKSYSNFFEIGTEVNQIINKSDEYSEFLGNHISDTEYLKQSVNDLQRPLLLIDSETHKIIFKLYK